MSVKGDAVPGKAVPLRGAQSSAMLRCAEAAAAADAPCGCRQACGCSQAAACRDCGSQRGDCALFVFVFVRGVPALPLVPVACARAASGVSAVGGAVHLDDVVDGGIGTEGGEAFREAVADARVLHAVGRGQSRRQLVEVSSVQ